MAKLMINKNKKEGYHCTGDLWAFLGTSGQMHL